LTTSPANAARTIETILLTLILLVALVLRLLDLNTVRHNIDQAYPIWQGLRTLDTGVLPLIGQPSSVLFANPPLTGYLFLPVLALTRSVVAVYVFVIVLNTIAVWFGYRIAKDLLRDSRLALMVAFLMAVNPWLIEYSRTTWVQCLLPFGVSGLLWLLVPVLMGTTKRPSRRLFVTLICLTALVQTYLLAYFMVLPVVLLLILFRKRIFQQTGWRQAVLGGGAIFLIASAVYAYGLFRDPETAFGRAGNFTSQPARLTDEALTHAVRLVTGNGYAAARAPLHTSTTPLLGGVETVVHLLILAGLIVGFVLAVRALLRRESEDHQRDAATILLVWFIPPIVLMSYTGNAVHVFYQLLGLPAGYALAAWGVQPLLRLIDQSERRLALTRLATAVSVSLGIGITLLITVNLRAAADEIRESSGAGMQFGIPLGDGLRLAEAINAEQMEQTDPVFTNVEPTLISTLLGRWTTVIPDALPPELSVIPQSGGVYAQFTGIGDQPRQPLFSEEQTILPLADGYSFAIFSYGNGVAETILDGTFADAEDTQPVEVVSEQGITLKRYSLAQNRSGRWTLVTFWQVDDTAVDTLQASNYGLFVHIFNPSEDETEEGERTQILNGVVVPGRLWQVGDLIVQRVRFETAEPFWLQVGFYDANAQTDLLFSDDTGELSPFIRLEGVETR
jgi:hypothetical protein